MRLHLDGNRNPLGLFQMSALEDACPELIDLKISGLGAAGAFVVELEETLTLAESGCDGNVQAECESDFMMPTSIPPKLRRIVVQPGPEPNVALSVASRETASIKDKVMMKRLNELKTRKVSDSGVQLEILQRSLAYMSLEDLRKEWLERL